MGSVITAKGANTGHRDSEKEESKGKEQKNSEKKVGCNQPRAMARLPRIKKLRG